MDEPDRISAPGGGGAAPKPGRGVRIALIVSLVVNLLFAGLIAGAMVRGHAGGMRGMQEQTGLGPLVAALTRADRAALRDEFRKTMGDRNAARKETAQGLTRLAAALRADPWDATAAKGALDQLSQRSQDRLQQGQAVLLTHLGAMPPADRQALAARLETAAASPPP